MVADALSRKLAHTSAVITTQKAIQQDLERAGVAVAVGEVAAQLAQLTIKLTLRQHLIDKQHGDLDLVGKRRLIDVNQTEEFSLTANGGLLYHVRLCVPNEEELKIEILTEAHHSPFALHLDSTKMYQDLKRHYWWRNMKHDVAEFVSKCLSCQQVKAPRQKPAGLLQPLSVPEWKWKNITMDFIVGLPRTARGYTIIWVVVDRLTKSAHFLPGKSTYSVDINGLSCT